MTHWLLLVGGLLLVTVGITMLLFDVATAILLGVPHGSIWPAVLIVAGVMLALVGERKTTGRDT